MIKKIFFLLLVFNFFSCAIFQTSEDKTDILIPGDSETPGWKLDGSIKEYTAGNLNEYVKESEKTLLNTYCFKELFVAKYKNISKPDNIVTIEIFTMDSALNAFGILSMERSEDSKEENICEDSYSTSHAMVSRKENYYIKIISGYESSFEDAGIFLKIICDKIKNINPLPRYLSLFENKDNKKYLVYRLEGHPKLPIIKDIFTRKIDIFENNKVVFFAKRESSYSSMTEFLNLLRNKEKQFILSSAGDSRTAFLQLNDNDYIFISVFKEWIFGILDAESMTAGEKAINFLFNGLKEFLKDTR